MDRLNIGKFVIVDLYSGSYTKNKIGHEVFNLNRNSITGKFYGYCPPTDGLNIRKLGANNTDEFIDGVLVIYVCKKKNSNNREIIAFSLNSRVYDTRQPGNMLNRAFIDKDGIEQICSYSVMSDNLYDLRTRFNKFEIIISNYSNKMFRNQKVYCGKYPKLDKIILAYIKDIIANPEMLDNEDNYEQEEIQRVDPADSNEINKAVNNPLNIANGSHGKIIIKNSRLSKKALFDANYSCAIDVSHKTFITNRNVPYMEGHHLIPCTVSNSEYFKKKFDKNIDCYENIVCLCPNCHREIHFGEWETKSQKIKLLFKKQQKKLESIGISITEKELLGLYKI